MTKSNAQNHKPEPPFQYKGVMVSSTFTDLKEHRTVLIKAIDRLQMKPIVMENDSAKPSGDVIDSSMQMVRDASAYVGVISHKYGQVPECERRNPEKLSLTELEFNEARRLNRPILLFIMGDEHPVKKNDVEADPEKIKKLREFRENAKLLCPDSSVHRVYAVFNSLHDFELGAIQSVAELRRLLESTNGELTRLTSPEDIKPDPIPRPPSLYAEPAYIGSHQFVGRQAQIDILNDWAAPADSHPVLLFEAIGGAGKSMLTWEWTTKHAVSLREAWAGRFWYSFYEKGAVMADFCRRALAYMTGQSRHHFKNKNTGELTELLMHQLQVRPWLLVLDGLERVLVSYHRFDAAQLADEQAGTLDKMAQRDPCAAINPEDDDLLRALAGAHPSKLLLTSRLVPRILTNNSGQPIPGVLRERLPGLRPIDAESMIRTCGVTGDSVAIQNYLKSHCDCHPLVIGVLAGLIQNYLPAKGNFDTWVADPSGGGRLNFANLNLTQKRNHILKAALTALPEKSRELLSTLALLSEAVDYVTLVALNPHMPPEPDRVEEPEPPERKPKWKKLSDEERILLQENHAALVERRREYEQALKARKLLMPAADQKLAETVSDLERRGLLQYDEASKRYDLHPVVRGVSAGGLKPEEKTQYGKRMVDHFSQQAQNPYEQAETLGEFDNARRIVKAYFHMGRLEQAREFIARSTFVHELNSRFEAHNEILTIVQPFFHEGWASMPKCLEGRGGFLVAKRAAVALRRIDALNEAYSISEALVRYRLDRNRNGICSQLLDLASTAGEQNRLAREAKLIDWAARLAPMDQHRNELISLYLARFRQRSRIGAWAEADEDWFRLGKEELTASEAAIAAHHYALFLFFQGKLSEEELAKAEGLNRASKAALGIRDLLGLRGFWCLEQTDWKSARDNLQIAVTLAHKVGKADRRSEIRLALAKYHLKQLTDPRQDAERLSENCEGRCERALAELWLAIGDNEQAKSHAHAAFKWAWADGEPYVHCYELDKTRVLLHLLGQPIQKFLHYDPSNDELLGWEQELSETIERLQAACEAKRKGQMEKTRAKRGGKSISQNLPPQVPPREDNVS